MAHAIRNRHASGLMLLLAASSGALAQSMPAADQTAPLPPQVVMPDAEKIVLLLRVR